MRGLLLIGALAFTGCDFQSAFHACIDAGWCADAVDAGDGGAEDAGTTRSCGTSGWCWETPLPRVALLEVLAVSPSEAWAFGEFGTALRFDGAQWNSISGRTEVLNSAVSLGPGVVLVGSSRGLFVLDGGAWTPITAFTTQVEALGRDPSGELFATSSSGWYRSLNGATWSPIPFRCNAFDFTFPAPGKGWVSCTNGGIFARAEDGGWVAQVTPTQAELYSVWAPSPAEAWAAGSGTLLHFREDAGWEALDAGVGDSVIFGDSAGPEDTWFGSNGGGLVHWTSAGPEAPVLLNLSINAISIGGDGGWVAGEQGRLARLDGTTWTEWSAGSLSWVWSLHGTAADDVWAVRSGGLTEHFDGVQWSPRPLPLSIDLYAVFARAPADVWAVGQSGGAFHWNGSEWAGVGLMFSGNLSSVWVDAAGVAWIAGSNGVLRRATPELATAVNHPITADFTDVWGVGQELWAAVSSGQVLHCDLSEDAGCALMTPPGPQNLTSIYASSPTDVWVISESGTVHQWNGSSWLSRRSVGLPLLHSVRGDGTANGVNVVGNDGFVQHFGRDGGSAMLRVDTNEAILSTFATADGGLTFIGGSAGALLRRGR